MPKKQSAIPVIEMLDTSELEIESGFNVRSSANFKSNVKELSSLIEARGGIDPSIHVVQYVERNGKKIIRGGHTLHASATGLGIKQVPAVKTDMDAVSELVNLVTSNAGHPLSQYEQGEVYMRLRDGNDPEKLEVGEELRAPLTISEIAKLIGLSIQHISNCLVVRECHPDVAAMVIDGRASANAVTLASRNIGSKEVVLKILRAAVENAKSDGKDTATEKHVKAVKNQFIKPKTLKAKTSVSVEPSKPSEPAHASSTNGATASEPENNADIPDEPTAKPEPQTLGDLMLPTIEPPKPDASPKQQKLFEDKVEKAAGVVKDELFTIITKWGEETDTALSDEDITLLIERITEAKLPF